MALAAPWGDDFDDSYDRDDDYYVRRSYHAPVQYRAAPVRTYYRAPVIRYVASAPSFRTYRQRKLSQLQD